MSANKILFLAIFLLLSFSVSMRGLTLSDVPQDVTVIYDGQGGFLTADDIRSRINGNVSLLYNFYNELKAAGVLGTEETSDTMLPTSASKDVDILNGSSLDGITVSLADWKDCVSKQPGDSPCKGPPAPADLPPPFRCKCSAHIVKDWRDGVYRRYRVAFHAGRWLDASQYLGAKYLWTHTSDGVHRGAFEEFKEWIFEDSYFFCGELKRNLQVHWSDEARSWVIEFSEVVGPLGRKIAQCQVSRFLCSWGVYTGCPYFDNGCQKY